MGIFDGWGGQPDDATAMFGGPGAPLGQQQNGLLGGQGKYAFDGQGITNFLGDNRQALVGLGMGLMSGNRGMGDALAGYQAGARSDMVANAQIEKRKKEQEARAAALAFAKSKGFSPEQSAMLVANPDVAAHVLQTQLEPKEASDAMKFFSKMNPDLQQQFLKSRAGVSTPEAKWAKVGEKIGEFGDKEDVMGWVNAGDQSVKPFGMNGGGAPGGPSPGVGVRLPSSTDGSGGANAPVPAPSIQTDGKPESLRDYINKYPDVDRKLLRQKYTEAMAKKEFEDNTPGENPYAPKGKVTADQAKEIGYANRMATAHKQINALGSVGTSRIQQGLNAVPGVSNSLISDEKQRLEQAQANFVNAILRRESGAAIAQGEFDNARKQYFPQPGDRPANIEQKRLNREEAIKGVMAGAGPNYKPPSISDGNETAPGQKFVKGQTATNPKTGKQAVFDGQKWVTP